jgi:hypothetical protein
MPKWKHTFCLLNLVLRSRDLVLKRLTLRLNAHTLLFIIAIGPVLLGAQRSDLSLQLGGHGGDGLFHAPLQLAVQ